VDARAGHEEATVYATSLASSLPRKATPSPAVAFGREQDASLYTGDVRIVTTHLGADFDAVGAAVGGTLLWPDARIVFPGSQEAAVRRFLAAEAIELPEIRVRELRRTTLDGALVVDCSELRRLGEVGELIATAGCPVEVIDHHPSTEGVIPGAQALIAPVAATCTVVARELQRRDITPAAHEASLLLLGIYEDTGGLTYADTTPSDASAAAWLLECGARLDWVRRYVLRPLEPEQLELLNQLVEGAVEHRIAGIRVVVSRVRPADQVEEAAYVVHRYAEIFDLPVVVAVLETPPQLVVIARSTHPRLDAGRLLAPLGGGGHATAAACRIRGMSSVELGERLLADIHTALQTDWNAGALANPHLHTCASTATVTTAKDRLVRLRINAMPVAEGDRLVGLVTRQILDSAISHGLGGRPVTTVMSPGVERMAWTAPVEDVERALMERGARLVVVDRPEGRGVITRMDLFRRFHQRMLAEGQRVDRRVAGARPVVHAEGARLRRSLPSELLGVLEGAGEVAETLGMRAFLVGGAVRDVLLGRAIEDIDLVVEGSGPDLAQGLVTRFGGGLHAHEPFMTAVVQLANGVRLDVATARTEFYRSPAALPEVESSALRQDLYRRDFTINALAANLSPGSFGELIDFFGGQHDLEARQIRVLHSLSFLDDPTRVIRAARFGVRLGFEIAADTRHLIRVAVQEGVFARLSGERLRDELAALLDEDHPADALRALDRMGTFPVLFPHLRWNEGLRRLLRSVDAMLAWSRLEGVYAGRRWAVYLAAAATRMADEAGPLLAARLSLAGEHADIVARARVGCERLLSVVQRDGVRPSEVVAALERSHPAWWVVVMAHLSEPVRAMLHDALTVWIRESPPVTGRQLLAAGIPSGPAVGEALQRTRAAVLDGDVSRGEALRYAINAAREAAS
jgi:tRNA nucleotidyltransferase (CCA-adding enzyme)